MQGESTEVMSARAKAEALLRAGRLSEARRVAREGLSEDGPDAGQHAGLYVVLGRAHAAEDADDHDDRAEAVFREGLDSFPDDLDLLSEYAQFCLQSDGFEHPGRPRRAVELVARLQELAPGSAQAVRAAQASGGRGVSGPKPASRARVQRQDARLALRAGEPAAQVYERAAERPGDDRLAVLAETLTALERPRRGLMRTLVRAPFGSALVLAAVQAAVFLSVPAFRLPWWVSCGALLTAVPHRVLSGVLRGARKRADVRELPADAPVLTDAVAPSVSYTRREKALTALVLVVSLSAAAGSVMWQYAQYLEYPRYTASAPSHFRGMNEVVDAPILDSLAAVLGQNMGRSGIEPFAHAYVDDPDTEVPGAAIVLFGMYGDMHEMSSKDVDSFRSAMRQGLGDNADFEEWDADPGAYGGWMRCMTVDLAYTNGESKGICTWGDKGSYGTVMSVGSSFDKDDRKGVEDLTRSLRQTVLDPA
ncbi:hypothetical protein [Streptomyces beijiangensis]|uniref:Tetratricopeptide repeat protein n=1 Tax=Streptomyces beijiangensis TaxID=163361 RepID=A0A939JH16_9ACTN|nr:hypothetical protein [Streptomyces beijiangensis]MBO0513993.1 hypothetical protein [Streptomyces beijiangensis]